MACIFCLPLFNILKFQVFIDIKDNSDILMNCDGAVLERKSLNRIFVQAFLFRPSVCTILLNDVEALLLQGKGQLSVSMSRQVRLNNVVLHPCVDNATYKSTREMNFKPLDGYPFELFRASIDPYVSPPVTVNMLMEYNQQRHTVRITASFSLRKNHNLHLRPVEDLVIKFPIPSSWSSQFLAVSTFGSKKSVQSTSVLRGSFRRKIKSISCQIETQLGSAMYEPEYGAVMWRIGHYVESHLPHNFRCDLELKPGKCRKVCKSVSVLSPVADLEGLRAFRKTTLLSTKLMTIASTYYHTSSKLALYHNYM